MRGSDEHSSPDGSGREDGTASDPCATPCLSPAPSSELSDTPPQQVYSSEAELEGQVKTLCLHLLNPHASASAGTPWPAQGEQCSGR